MSSQLTLTGGSIAPETINAYHLARDVLGMSTDDAFEMFDGMDPHTRAGWVALMNTDELFYADPSDVHVRALRAVDPRAVAFLLAEAFTLEEATEFAAFETRDGDEVPVDVLRVCAPAVAWHQFDPTGIPTLRGADGDTYYRVHVREGADEYGECHDGTGLVNDHGEVYGDDYVAYIDDDLWHAPGGDGDGPDVVVGRDSWHEHANTLITVLPDGTRSKVEHSDGVMFDAGVYMDEFDSLRALPSDAYEFVEGVVMGTITKRVDGWRSYDDGPSETAGWAKAKAGWHSSMEGSTQQVLINELTSGERPVAFPVAVGFTRTSNVFSIGLDVYAPIEHVDEMDALFDGTSGAPGHGGVR